MASSWLAFADRFYRVSVAENPIGPPSFVRMGFLINLFKATTPVVVLLLMVWYSSFSFTSKLYFCLHGSYGLFWLFKEALFPDPSWNVRLSPGGAMMVAITLLLYWSPGFLITSRHLVASELQMMLSILLYVTGIVLMIGSDAQKTLTLRIRKGLITDGFFSLCRNPNYFVSSSQSFLVFVFNFKNRGEMIVKSALVLQLYCSREILIYTSFSILSMHWFPFVYCLYIWAVLFWPNMVKKDKSVRRERERERECGVFLLNSFEKLSRHAEFKAYAKGNLLIPDPFVVVRALQNQ
jgi:hypothetical protein